MRLFRHKKKVIALKAEDLKIGQSNPLWPGDIYTVCYTHTPTGKVAVGRSQSLLEAKDMALNALMKEVF